MAPGIGQWQNSPDGSGNGGAMPAVSAALVLAPLGDRASACNELLA